LVFTQKKILLLEKTTDDDFDEGSFLVFFGKKIF